MIVKIELPEFKIVNYVFELNLENNNGDNFVNLGDVYNFTLYFEVVTVKMYNNALVYLGIDKTG